MTRVANLISKILLVGIVIVLPLMPSISYGQNTKNVESVKKKVSNSKKKKVSNPKKKKVSNPKKKKVSNSKKKKVSDAKADRTFNPKPMDSYPKTSVSKQSLEKYKLGLGIPVAQKNTGAGYEKKPLYGLIGKNNPQEEKTEDLELEEEEELEPEFMLVEITSERLEDEWIARALESKVSHDIFSYPQIKPVDRSMIPAQFCEADRDCILKVAEQEGVLLVLQGRLVDRKVHLELFQVWNGAKIDQGQFSIAEGDQLSKVKLEIFKIIKPLLAQGGILDQVRERRKVAEIQNEALATQKPYFFSSQTDAYFVGMLMFFAIPILYRFLLFLMSTLLYGKKTHFDWVIFIYVFFIGILAGVFSLLSSSIHIPGKSEFFLWLADLNLVETTTFYLISGVLWSTVLVMNIQFYFRPLYKMEEIPHNSLRHCIQAFAVSSLFRMMISMLIHFCLYYWIISAFPDIDFFSGYSIVLVPTLMIAMYLCLFTMFELFALHCDLIYAQEKPGITSTFHQVLSTYVDHQLLINQKDFPEICRNALYIAGPGKGVSVYGGVWRRPRIVVGQELVDDAIPSRYFERLEEISEADSELESDESIENTSETLDIDGEAEILDLEGSQEVEEGSTLNEELAKALTEDDENGRDEEGEDDDDLESPRDFLFGAILPAAALIYRRGHWKMSILNIIFDSTNGDDRFLDGFRYLAQVIYDRYAFMFERIITDSFAVAAGGYHHLIQHLCYIELKDDRLLSAGADHFSLVNHSEAILDLASSMHNPEQDKYTVLDRLVALGGVYSPEAVVIPKKKIDPSSPLRLIKPGLIVFTSFCLFFFFVLQSIDYRAVYKDRLEKEQRILDKELKKLEQKEANKLPTIGDSK